MGLVQLCQSLQKYRAGCRFDLVLSANGFGYAAPLDLRQRFARCFVRENSGYNLAAWDHAWRQLAEYDHFLFLQDDCVVRSHEWLGAFVAKFTTTARCGLVGENVDRWWDQPWSSLCDPPNGLGPEVDADMRERAEWAQFFREKLREWNIPKGQTARHATTVVQFTSRAVLEEVDGYNFGRTKLEATAAEIAFSRKIAAKGYTVVQLGRWRHSKFAHPQWSSNAPADRLWRILRKRFRFVRK